MTGSAAYRKFLCCNIGALCALFLFPKMSYALQPQMIYTDLPEPAVSYVDDGSHTTVSYYVESYDTTYNRYELIAVTAVYPTNTDIVFRAVDYNYTYLMGNKNAISGSYVGYDPITGGVTNSGSCAINADRVYVLGGAQYYPASQNRYSWYVLPDQVQFTNYKYHFAESAFIVFSVTPEVTTYKSMIPEPVSDPYNRYIVLAGTQIQKLYWISYHDITFHEPIIEGTYDGHTFQMPSYQLIGSIYPHVTIEDNNIAMSLEINNAFLQIANYPSNGLIFDYNIQISSYDLLTGEFVDTAIYEDTYVSTDSTTLNYNFGAPSAYNAVCAYGVFYSNQSRNIYNRLICEWAINPAFEEWKSSMLDYSRLIYEALAGSGENVTLDIQSNAEEELESARSDLEMTDENGNVVDPVDQANDAFSQAAAGVSQLAAPISEINNQISDNVFSEPLLILPIIVALALGLAVTILGKDKSD